MLMHLSKVHSMKFNSLKVFERKYLVLRKQQIAHHQAFFPTANTTRIVMLLICVSNGGLSDYLCRAQS